MRLIILIFLSLFTFSCGLPKDLRHYKKGSKKLAKLVTKYPELKHDSIIRDTIPVYIVEYVHDTIILLETDTVLNEIGEIQYVVQKLPKHFEYDKEGVKVSLDRFGNGYKLTVLSKADTVHVPFEVAVPVITPAKIIKAPLSKWQLFLQNSGWTLWILVVILIVIMILKILGKLTIPIKIG